jgi:hypothetical protein
VFPALCQDFPHLDSTVYRSKVRFCRQIRLFPPGVDFAVGDCLSTRVDFFVGLGLALKFSFGPPAGLVPVLSPVSRQAQVGFHFLLKILFFAGSCFPFCSVSRSVGGWLESILPSAHAMAFLWSVH